MRFILSVYLVSCHPFSTFVPHSFTNPILSHSHRFLSPFQPSPILLLGPPFTPFGHSLRPAKRMATEGWGEEPNQEPDEVRI